MRLCGETGIGSLLFQVWVDSVTEMTRDDLCAEDGDSPPQDLVYLVTPPSNGHLALKSVPGRSIQNFTQAQIDEGHLVFVHSGKSQGRAGSSTHALSSK